MPAINFTVFIDKVASGEKVQTIRAPRKRPIRCGDWVYLYTGMRTKACKKLGQGVVTEVFPIVITADGGSSYPKRGRPALARRDGFASWPKLVEWFRITHGLPFYGTVVCWRLIGGK